MAKRPRIREPTAEVLETVMDEHEYNSLDRAMTHVLREAGYCV